jgi:hypothetical protein
MIIVNPPGSDSSPMLAHLGTLRVARGLMARAGAGPRR